MTAIPYVDESWNLTAGCSMVNAGCLNCWGIQMAARLAARGIAGYEGTTKDGKWIRPIHLLPRNLNKPVNWEAPRRIFVNSMSDIFHEEIPDWYFGSVLGIMRRANQHVYLLFTKRYKRAHDILSNLSLPPNVWIIFSVSNQEIADFARPYLKCLATWGWNTGVSYEPALGPVDWRGWEFIKWMVVGAESGKDRRPFEIKWAMETYHWAWQQNILFYMKQGSAFKPSQQGCIPDPLWNYKEVVPLPNIEG